MTSDFKLSLLSIPGRFEPMSLERDDQDSMWEVLQFHGVYCFILFCIGIGPDDGNNTRAKEAYQSLFIFALLGPYETTFKSYKFRKEVVQTAKKNYGYEVKEPVSTCTSVKLTVYFCHTF